MNNIELSNLIDAVKGHCAVYAAHSTRCQFVCDELTDEHIAKAIRQAVKEFPLDPKDPEKDAIEIALEYAEGAMEYMNYAASPDYNF